MKLTKLSCDKAKPSEKPRKLADGNGLYLEVMPNGSKYWRMKYRHLGKEKRLAFGVYPEVSLKDAKDIARAAKLKIRDGVDPVEERKMTRSALIAAQKRGLTFNNAVDHNEDDFYDEEVPFSF